MQLEYSRNIINTNTVNSASCSIEGSQQITQPRPQGLLAYQYGGGKQEDPGDEVANNHKHHVAD